MIHPNPNTYNKFSSTASREMRGAVSVTSLYCAACGKLTTGAHSCPRCHHYIHSTCGRLEGEGYGSSVVCPDCDLAERRIPFDSMRAGIKRNQERFHERMLNTSSKKLRPAEVDDTVVIPIAHPDQFELCTTNLLCCNSVPDVKITQTQAMQSASLGTGSSCRCGHCRTLRCPCKKASRNCNSKCHKGRTCFNKFSFT